MGWGSVGAVRGRWLGEVGFSGTLKKGVVKMGNFKPCIFAIMLNKRLFVRLTIKVSGYHSSNIDT